MAFLTPITEYEASLKPDIVGDSDCKSINLNSLINTDMQSQAFSLMDANENLLIKTVEKFYNKLNCNEKMKIKVVSIFGNTGDGKSHAMNHIFFGGHDVFKTSDRPISCTMGVHAAMQCEKGILCLDTEGLLGITETNDKRMRMLLKILAISDIVIYLTRSPRLGLDMFQFLGYASKAFIKYFAQALKPIIKDSNAMSHGPAIIIFHETQHTDPLSSQSLEACAEQKLHQVFLKLNLEIDAFSSLRYIGTKTDARKGGPTNYNEIIGAIEKEIDDTTQRSKRQPSIIFEALKDLNEKFSGDIQDNCINPFPEQYFTCKSKCEACGKQCECSMGHMAMNEDHMIARRCTYNYQYDNKVYLCNKCYGRKDEVLVTISTQKKNDTTISNVMNFALKGYVIECRNCGEIYRSRQFWYGNKTPEESGAVREEYVHVWTDGTLMAKGATHTCQIMLNGISTITETITTNLAPSTKVIKDLVSDKLAPSYWVPNYQIKVCEICKKNFDETGLPKHHCRGCGKGFCHGCSQNKVPVPTRGWMEPSRVCNDCYGILQKNPNAEIANTTAQIIHTNSHNNIAGTTTESDTDLLPRKCVEIVGNTVGSAMRAALGYTKDVIKDSARPDYWEPDADTQNCHICKMLFGTAEELELAKAMNRIQTNPAHASRGDCYRHHCRKCGKSVCDKCSEARQPVPERGWQTNERVCDDCVSPAAEHQPNYQQHQAEYAKTARPKLD